MDGTDCLVPQCSVVKGIFYLCLVAPLLLLLLLAVLYTRARQLLALFGRALCVSSSRLLSERRNDINGRTAGHTQNEEEEKKMIRHRPARPRRVEERTLHASAPGGGCSKVFQFVRPPLNFLTTSNDWETKERVTFFCGRKLVKRKKKERN